MDTWKRKKACYLTNLTKENIVVKLRKTFKYWKSPSFFFLKLEYKWAQADRMIIEYKYKFRNCVLKPECHKEIRKLLSFIYRILNIFLVFKWIKMKQFSFDSNIIILLFNYNHYLKYIQCVSSNHFMKLGLWPACKQN